MSSPVISAYDAGLGSTIRGIEVLHGRPCQLSDLKIQIESDLHSFLELSNLMLPMLGSHQLHNASTAACTALCLRNQGWRISDDSIRAGLETTHLLGRSQYLSVKEAEELGLPRSRVLLDGAHTKESAKALAETIRMSFPEAQVALVVAMASDKDHSAFARELISGIRQLAAVFLTEVIIAGGKSRTTSASVLRKHWVQASKEMGIDAFQAELDGSQGSPVDQMVCLARNSNDTTLLISENSLEICLVLANQILEQFAGERPSLIVVTGSLHVVSSVLASLRS